jgi:hypothetical protein
VIDQKILPEAFACNMRGDHGFGRLKRV